MTAKTLAGWDIYRGRMNGTMARRLRGVRDIRAMLLLESASCPTPLYGRMVSRLATDTLTTILEGSRVAQA